MSARLRTLGAVDLRDAAGREVTAILRQPKRLALLVYLALEGRGHFLRRDTIVGLFWPELDQEHARAALRRALHFLRRGLGEDLIDGRGDEEVRLRPGAVTCDASECLEHLAAGRATEALVLAGGDFLPGLYVAGAPGMEQWLDGERGMLRQRIQLAAWALAEGSGDSTTRIASVERAVRCAPDDATLLRRALTLLDRFEAHDAALRLFEEYRRRVLDLELEPDPALVAQAAALRKRWLGQVTGPVAAAEQLLAILPFTMHAPAELEYLGEGMVDLLATALDGIAGIRALDPTSLLAWIRGTPTPPDLESVARQFHARWFITGTIVATPGEFRVQASCSDSHGVIIARADASATTEAGVFEVVDALTRALVAGWPEAAGGRLGQIAARTTASLTALRAWLTAEQDLRLGRVLAAGTGFGTAAEADPSFALAHYRQAAAAAASAWIGPAREASTRAMAHRGRLSERDRLLVEAQDAWLTGRLDEAERRYAAAVGGWPEDADAWFLLGDLLFHGNPYRGRSIREARAPLERALALDSRRVSALGKLARLAALERRTEDVAALAARIQALSPDQDQALAVRALRAYTVGSRAEQDAIAAALGEARALTVGIAFSDVAVYGPSLEQATQLGRALAGVARSGELRALVHLMLAHLAAATGDLGLCRVELRTAAGLDLPWALETRGLLVALPFLPFPDAEIAATRSELEGWNPEAAAPNVSLPLAFHNGLHPHLRAYTMGLLAARQRDGTGVASALELLAELPEPDDAERLVERLERSLESLILELRGDAEGALAALAGNRQEPWFQFAVASPFYSGTFERWRRGRLLERLGRPDEARGWLGAIAERTPWELPFRATGSV